MFVPLSKLPLLQRSMIAASGIKADAYCLAVPFSEVKIFEPFARELEFEVVGSDEFNVVERLCHAIDRYKLDVVIHITGDKAFVSAKYTQLALEHYLSHTCDLTSYEESPLKETTGAIYYPPVLFNALDSIATTRHQLEHVKPCFTENPDCTCCKLPIPEHLKKIKNFTFMIDTMDDYLKVKEEYEILYRGWPLEIDEIVDRWK
jgi:spore coat polysaccharide biosynthesis protein SpsF (cytidylyltransferase family)